MNNDRMTCQICGRAIKAKNGRIAHHGFKRPGDGWQSASCEGARALPLEVSDEVLRSHIESVHNLHNRSLEIAAAPVLSVKLPVAKGTRDFSGHTVHQTADVTAENFEETRAASGMFWVSRSNPWSWADAVKRETFRREVDARRVGNYLKFQSDRLAAHLAAK